MEILLSDRLIIDILRCGRLIQKQRFLASLFIRSARIEDASVILLLELLLSHEVGERVLLLLI